MRHQKIDYQSTTPGTPEALATSSGAVPPEEVKTPGVAAVTAGSGLSPTMQEIADRMKSHGGTITRYPGGYWCIENAAGETMHPTYGTSSVQALVRRGVAEYCDWKCNAAGRFPIKARLRDPNTTMSNEATNTK